MLSSVTRRRRTFILRRLRMAEQATNCNFKALGFDKKLDYPQGSRGAE